MPLKRLLVLMLPGLLPLLAYVAAAELWGDLVGLWVGVSLGAAEFLYLLLFRRRFDGFVLLDTGLLVALGAISLGLADDVFFRLKPVFVEVLLVGLLAYSAWGPRNLLLGMVFKGASGEELKKRLEADPAAVGRMRWSLGLMTVVFAAHTALSLASALWMSKEVWAFVTGVLPFILVGALTLIQLLPRFLRRPGK